MRVLITDQFDTPSLEQRQAGIPFEKAVEYFAERNKTLPAWHTKARLVEVDDDATTIELEWATSAFIADENGNLKLWRARWDSSG